ncbi:MAG: ribosome assembly factor SBDS [Candidatus Pacearchaeota archaeon]
MVETTARIKREGKHFEILVDLEEALKVKKGEGNINQAVLTNYIFYNLKSGEHASKEDLEKYFGSSDFLEVCEKIIKNGEVVKTTDFLKEEQNQKYKQVVDFLVRNAISLEGRPYTPDRIMNSLNEAHVNIKNKPIETQINEILEQLNKVLPIKVERKRVKLKVSSMHIGKAYGYLREYLTKETWLNNGDLECIVEVPSGLIMDFYDKINSATQGSVLSEELK